LLETAVMKTNKTALPSVFLAPLVLLACEGPAEPELGELVTQASTWWDEGADTQLSGDTNQGRTLTGEAGPPLRGVEYQPAVLGGQQVTAVTVVGGRLVGRLADGRQVEGMDWVGALLQGRGADDSPVPLRIEQVRAHDPDVHVYTVSRGRGGETGPEWAPLCAEDLDGHLEAIPVAALWNQSNGDRLESTARFTFACRKGVVAKCITWGYRPWLDAPGAVGMTEVHQACTRAARADYCGNGAPHTLEGTAIRIYDRLAPAIRSHRYAEHDFEAGWSRFGATCLNHLRWRFLRPECDLVSEGAEPRGPFARDAVGQRLQENVCDTPQEAAAEGRRVFLFTESHSQGIEELLER
jgi:hypothetical protein